MADRAFPVIWARDVEHSASFYEQLGFERHVQLPSDGEPGYVGLRRGAYELAVVTVVSPQQVLGIEAGTAPRFELYVYVDDLDGDLERLRAAGVGVLKEPETMPWGERLAFVADPDGNPVTLAVAPDSA